jgi:hypothetical protein
MFGNRPYRHTKLLQYALCGFLYTQVLPLYAQSESAAETGEVTEPATETGDKTIQHIDQLWQQSKEVTGQWWDSSRQLLGRGTLSEQRITLNLPKYGKK